MAKKKAARRPTPRNRAAASQAKRTAARRAAAGGSSRARKVKTQTRRVKKTAARKGGAKKAAAKKRALKKGVASKAAVRKVAVRKVAARKAARTAAKRTPPLLPKKTASRKATPKVVVRRRPLAPVKAAAAPRPAPTPKAAAPKTAADRRPARPSRPQRGPAPGLNRERRIVTDDDAISSPSSFGFEPRASAAHSGGRELHEKYVNHPGDSGPSITGGDVDADWESAYRVGDEAPGGDNPTPDQDRVDDIGRALGVQYEDDEELEGEHKISERDRHRWEYDPASSDDWGDRED